MQGAGEVAFGCCTFVLGYSRGIIEEGYWGFLVRGVIRWKHLDTTLGGEDGRI